MEFQLLADHIQRLADNIALFVKHLKEACYCAMAKIRIFLRKIGILPYIRPRTRNLRRARLHQRKALA